MPRAKYSILQHRRGNTAIASALTGRAAEFFVNTDNYKVFVHDGITVGGHSIGGDIQTTANTIYTQGVDETQNTNIIAVNDLAQAAFDYANTILTLDANVDQVARDSANLAFENTIYTQGVDETQNTNIIAVNDLAQAAFDYANTQLGNYSFTNDTITNNVDNDVNITTNGNNWTLGLNGNTIVPGSIIPSANNEYSLGSAEFQWKSLFVSNNTIYIENVPLSLSGSNADTYLITIGDASNKVNVASETFVQSFQNIDGGNAQTVYSYQLLNLDGGGA